MTQHERMLAGQLYRASDPELLAASRRARELTRRFNQTAGDQRQEREHLLQALLGSVGEQLYIEPPFYCDYGSHISIGDRFYANFDCIILDVCPIIIGDDVLFGPRVSLLSASHPIDSQVRASGLECGMPITIGDRVWLGGGVIVNPGVTIGSDTIVGSGAVVTKNVPSGVIAVGNPCRVLRPITEEDRAFWTEKRIEYETQVY